jgi:N-acetylmuramoyl-L-alanine amidase
VGWLLAGAFCAACSGGKGVADAGVGDAAQLAQAQALLASREPLPARAELISLAQSIEARAVKEGAGARAVDLHALAGRLMTRVWRVEGREQDAKEAVDLLRAASKDIAVPGACDAALDAALLAGEAARDAGTTYAELYRAQRRFAGVPIGAAGSGPCLGKIEARLTALAAYRPPARILEAIEEGLAGEGAVASGAASARPNVKVTGQAPQIVRVEHWPGDENARVVVVVDKPARYRVVDEANAGGRVAHTFIELDGVDAGGPARDYPMKGIVSRVHTEAIATGSRVTLDLDGRAYRRVFNLLEPYRIVIDVAKHPPGAPAAGAARVVGRIVLDPGHGGTDPGAIGPSGAREKDITLDIAHKAAPVLARLGVQVALTRDDDRSVTLEERTARANGYNADLFVSIHCNAAEASGRHGIETYVLDTTRDDLASRVAARENATSQAATAEIGNLLASMRMADQAARSVHLAELLQKATLASIKPKFPDAVDGGVRTAGFYVLVGARMPGVLFETSYISNAADEQRLMDEDYRQRLADGIVNAVRAYREGR